jgi:hypothetical protein
MRKIIFLLAAVLAFAPLHAQTAPTLTYKSTFFKRGYVNEQNQAVSYSKAKDLVSQNPDALKSIKAAHACRSWATVTDVLTGLNLAAALIAPDDKAQTQSYIAAGGFGLISYLLHTTATRKYKAVGENYSKPGTACAPQLQTTNNGLSLVLHF